MAEEDTPNRDSTDEETPRIAVPSHAPLPPPPEVSYTRPVSKQPPRPAPLTESQQTNLSQGVQGYGLAITAAITLAVTLLAFVALGQWLDHRYNAGGTPWFTIVGLLIGVVGGFFNMIRLLTGPSRK